MSKRNSRPPLPPLAPREPPSSSKIPSLEPQLVRLVPILPLLPGHPQTTQTLNTTFSHCGVAHATPAPSTNHSLSVESALTNSDSFNNETTLRSGKWIPEEDEYAQLLIALFEGGLVTDCENGATLRSYLSQKLRCAPMRISKKFAGKGIGKMIYTCKFKHAFQQQHMQSLALKERIRATELSFLNAIDPAATLAPPSIQFSFPPSKAIPMPLPVVPQIVTAPVLPPPITSQAEDHTKLLHESYIRALQLKIDDGNQANTITNIAANPAFCFRPAQSTTPNSMQSSNMRVKESNVTEIPDFLFGYEEVDQSMNPLSMLKTTPIATTSDVDVFRPDLSTTMLAAGVSGMHHSPPFTSRSFDDFHRLLGTDLTLGMAALDQEEVKFHEPVAASNVSTSPVVPDTAALFVPESYAMFAEESALQTGRHGSDFLPLQGVDQLSNHPTVAFDVDGLLNQVREHTFGSTVPTRHTNETSRSRSHHKYRSREDDDSETVKKSTKKLMARRSSANSVSTDVPKATFTVERFMRSSNLVSGSEPSGSSSSNSNSNHEESSSMDTAGTDDNSEEESNHYSDSSSGGEMERPRCKKAKLVNGKSTAAGNARKNAATRHVQLNTTGI